MKDEYVTDIHVGKSEVSCESDTEITRCSDDTISRQAAIDALDCINGVEEVLRSLPSAQPTITHEQAIDYLHETGWLQSHDRILTEHEQMYKRAFSVACELLIGANLFGVTEETMFREIMDKDGIVSSLGYERYILDNLARLTGEDDDTD